MSHPLIKHLSNVVINNKLEPYSNNNYQILRQLGLFITYETLRNWLKTYKLTIKQIKKTQEIIMIDPKELYIIIFNDLQYLSFLQEIQLLIPTIQLKLVYSDELNQKNKYKNLLEQVNSCTKVIIINYNIELEYVTTLLNYLMNSNKITITQIRLICIKCNTNELICISKQYANLNIYTTKVIN